MSALRQKQTLPIGPFLTQIGPSRVMRLRSSHRSVAVCTPTAWVLGRIFGSKQCRGFAGWLSLPMSITAPYPSAASADRELGLQFLKLCVVQRLYRRWSLGSTGLLPDLGLFCWARPNGQRLACLLAVVDTYGKAIVVDSGLL